MPRRKVAEDQLGLLEVRTKTAPCVPGIRKAVAEWKKNGYKGVTDTTRILLNYWFVADHRLPNGRVFRYHLAPNQPFIAPSYTFRLSSNFTDLVYLTTISNVSQSMMFIPGNPGMFLFA